ncbi:MAG: hypothetical protein K8L97_11000 [Anaerolineae bacterium]|nr:hypothetical protein [Anaerolineae bacterium]
MMEIKVHTVGRITAEDRFNGWYVFIQTYKNSEHFLVLKANTKQFGADEKGNGIEGTIVYDSWMPDMVSLENYFEVNGWDVEWLDDPKPEWLEDETD